MIPVCMHAPDERRRPELGSTWLTPMVIPDPPRQTVVAPGRSAQIWRWLVCTARHRQAHLWFSRYLGGYGRCSLCGRLWE